MMDLQEFITAAQAFADLGSSVNGQLTDVIEKGQSLEEQNGNALEMISAFLWDVPIDEAQEFASEIDNHLATGHEGI